MWPELKGLLDSKFFKITNYFIFLTVFLAVFYFSWSRPNYLKYQLENFSPNHIYFIFFCFYTLSVSYTLLSFAQILKINHFWKVYWSLILLLFFTPPLLSMDVGAYILSAKNLISADTKVYLDALRGTATWTTEMNNVWWLNYPTVYGPVFLVIALISLASSSFGLLAMIFSYKLIVIVAFFLILYIFWISARDSGLSKNNFYLLALNPALLINWVVEGHNDVFLALGILACVYYLNQKKIYSAWLTAILTIFIKYTSLIFSPILIFENGKLKLNKLISFIGIIILTFSVFFKLSGLDLKLFLDNLVFLKSCFYRCSPLVFLSRLFSDYHGLIRLGLFSFLYGLIVWRYLYKQTDHLKFIFWSGACLFFVQTTWLTPWYPTILIPVGLLIKDKKYLFLVVLITWYSLLHYVVL